MVICLFDIEAAKVYIRSDALTTNTTTPHPHNTRCSSPLRLHHHQIHLSAWLESIVYILIPLPPIPSLTKLPNFPEADEHKWKKKVNNTEKKKSTQSFQLYTHPPTTSPERRQLPLWPTQFSIFVVTQQPNCSTYIKSKEFL